MDDGPHLRQIAAAPLLTPAEEGELTRRAARGELAARDQLLAANLRLVVSVARRYQNRGVPLPDLIQEGSIGLLRAIERFEPERGHKFSTYAIWWVRQAMTQALVEQGRTIRLPTHLVVTLRKVRRAGEELELGADREATAEEIAARTGLSPRRVAGALAAGRGATVATGVAASAAAGSGAGEGDAAVHAALAADGAPPSPAERLIERERALAARRALASLPPRERRVLSRRFGLDSQGEGSLADVGHDLRLSRERARQLEAKALRLLRTGPRAAALRVHRDG